MNEYNKHKIKSFYDSFQKQTFDQDDVALFLMSSRDYSEETSIFREIGDFLAHPNLKNRGIVLQSVKHVMPKFEKLLKDEYRGKDVSSRKVIFNGLGTDEEIIRNLEQIFTTADVKFEKITSKSSCYRDFIFCTIFLLSSFKLKYKERVLPFKVIYSYNLTLETVCESNEFGNNHMKLPILRLGSVWPTCPSIPSYTEYELQNHIVKRFKQGFLGAISYDHVTNEYDSEKFKNDIWPLLKHS